MKKVWNKNQKDNENSRNFKEIINKKKKQEKKF